jgi:hypothetical protein
MSKTYNGITLKAVFTNEDEESDYLDAVLQTEGLFGNFADEAVEYIDVYAPDKANGLDDTIARILPTTANSDPSKLGSFKT